MRTVFSRLLRLMVLAMLVSLTASAATPTGDAGIKQADPSPLPDDRYKADILVVIAHPDDETLISGYLAKVVLDDGKRVSVVFTTRGNAGDNEVGYEQAAALADMREMEARRALGSIGVTNVWFLDAPDTPAPEGHDVLRSLETANHGSILGKIVRFMRLTRPDVVLTFLPNVVAGENHEDHQASGVIATEAFDMAGDPTRFPEQVAFPDNRTGYGNLMEGLRPWQPEKLYYFSDALHTDFLEGKGPKYEVTGTSHARQAPYYRLKAVEASYYQTQIGIGANGAQALKSGNYAEFQPPEFFVLGKSAVKCTVTGDIFEGIVPGPVPFLAVRGYQRRSHAGTSVELGGPWNFYREFWLAHNLDQLAGIPAPEIGTGGGSVLFVPLLVRNDTDQDRVLTLKIDLPVGWQERQGTARYPVRAHDVYPVRAILVVPPATQGSWQDLRFRLEEEGAGSPATLKVFVGKGPQ